MLKLTEEIRNEIVKIIVGSQLPTNQGVSIINALNNLETISELPIKENKNGGK